MNRYLTSLLVIPVLVSVLFSGCSTDSQQRITKLEQQVAALTKQAQEEPIVIEKDIEAPNHYQLPLQLKVGDRVEGEVSITPSNNGYLYGEVKDPYGNIVVVTPRIDIGGTREIVQRFVNPPWRFAFIAATDGEYTLEVSYSRNRMTEQPVAPVAHLKIVHYTGN